MNVTNITYTNSTVYNYGPDYNQLSQRSSHPIQRLTLERQTNVVAGAAIQPGAAMKVESGKLIVAAPMTVKKAPPTVAPKSGESENRAAEGGDWVVWHLGPKRQSAIATEDEDGGREENPTG